MSVKITFTLHFVSDFEITLMMNLRYLWILAWFTWFSYLQALDDFRFVVKIYSEFLIKNNIFFLFSESPYERIINLGKNCSTDGQKINANFTNFGWQCEKDCIFLDWVCDGNELQCFPDTDDEKIGCKLFPGNK